MREGRAISFAAGRDRRSAISNWLWLLVSEPMVRITEYEGKSEEQ